MVEVDRVYPCNTKPVRHGDFVVYWMQASQRAEYNHALEYAILQANELSRPVVCVFGLTRHYPEANARHYTFMLEGLRETRERLAERGVPLVIEVGSPDEVVLSWAQFAALLVTDVGVTRIQRQWRSRVAQECNCAMAEVESDVVVPHSIASDKEEYSAATLRRKITPLIPHFLREPPRVQLIERAYDIDTGVDLGSIPDLVRAGGIDCSVGAVTRWFRGGVSEAHRRLAHFVRDDLVRYGEERCDPSSACVSTLSPYLHFGQISPVEVARTVREAGRDRQRADGAKALLEELIVRRELSVNFVAYCDRYDDFACLPDWARATLGAHASDSREIIYTVDELERAGTHDPYWNAAMQQMLATGWMHPYMRMYWAKRILGWSSSPEEAYVTTLRLNNRYFVDGRDPNSFAGVAWCYGKHDRPWKGRPVFGTVRTMTAGGLERKFAIGDYVSQMARLQAG